MPGSILALDTSGSFCSVALRRADGAVLERSSTGDGDHFEQLPGLVQDTLSAGQLTVSELSSIVVGIGPGSFTGLRIGLSYAKGLATAAHLPLQGVSSFEGLAAVMLMEQREIPGVVVVSDARREEIFIAAYARGSDDQAARLVAGPVIMAVSQLGKESWAAPGWVWCSPQRDLSVPGKLLAVSPGLARGLLVCAPPPGVFSLSEIAALEPSYLRAVSAKTIEERRQGGLTAG